MDLFTSTWSALRSAVAALPPDAVDAPSGCRGWRVRDLVHHLVVDGQDVLVTLATPADSAPNADALSCWTPSPTLPDGEAPRDALTRRLADAYEDPGQLRDQLEYVGAAAERAALLAPPDLPVEIRGRSLTVRDYLQACVLEWTLHHLDLVAYLDPADGAENVVAAEPAGPPAAGLAAARDMVERRLHLTLPATWSDTAALRIATGRRPATSAEQAELDALGPRGQMLPLSFG